MDDAAPEGEKSPENKIVELLTEMRDALKHEHKAQREWREKHTKHDKRWYNREPFKGVLTHAVTVLVAVCVGYLIHEVTGKPIVIEAAYQRIEVDAGAPAIEISSSEPIPALSIDLPTSATAVAASPIKPPQAKGPRIQRTIATGEATTLAMAPAAPTTTVQVLAGSAMPLPAAPAAAATGK